MRSVSSAAGSAARAVTSSSCRQLRFVDNVITTEEETQIVQFLGKILSRKKYEGNHWDSVIQQYKELELSNYKVPPEVAATLARTQSMIRDIVDSPFEFLSPHVIELSEEGFIGPHVDSIKFSGGFVAGLSLLSTRIMALSLNTEGAVSMEGGKADAVPELLQQDGHTVHAMEAKVGSAGSPTPAEYLPQLVEITLPPRSLYVLMGPWRYNYSHAILGTKQTPKLITPLLEPPTRRASIIFRDAKK